MKNDKNIIKILSFFLLITMIFVGCPNPNNSTVPPITTIGGDEIDTNVTSSLADAVKSLGDDGLMYIYEGDFSYEAKDSAGGWKNITNEVLDLENAGNDKLLKISYDLQGTARQLEIGFMLNGKNISKSIWSTKLYIPETYATAGEAAYPVIQLWAKYGESWTATEAVKLNSITIGSGWHTIEIDIENNTVKIDGNIPENLSAGETTDVKNWSSNLTAAKSVGLTFYADGIPTSMEGSFYIDYINISGITQALPNTPSISCTANTVSIMAEDGANIYYTIDGTDPTAESNLYTAPFEIGENKTVKAIAVKDGLSSLVATKVCNYVAAGSQGSAKITFTETATEKKPNFKYNPTEEKILASASIEVYVPNETYTFINGGKLYFKTGDSWTWNEGSWTNLVANEWTKVEATFSGQDLLKEIGFNGYGKQEQEGNDLVLYFDNLTITYTDGTSESFDFNDGIPENFSFESHSEGSGTISLSTEVFYQ